jgi:hypothetical protein
MSDLGASSLRTTRRIVLIGSMGVYHQMLDIASQLGAVGIQTVVPDAEVESVRQMALFEFEDFKRRVSFAHLRRIRDPRTYCVLAVNPDRYGILNYLGPNTFAEIAVAFAQSKKIYLLQGAPEAYLDELSAWRSISLRWNLQHLVTDFQHDCMVEDPQMRLL